MARRGRLAHRIELRQIRLGVETRIFDAGDDERRVGEAGARSVRGRDERRGEIFLHVMTVALRRRYTVDRATCAQPVQRRQRQRLQTRRRPARRRSARGPGSCWSRRHSRNPAPRADSSPHRESSMATHRRGSMSRPLDSRSRSNASRYGAGDGLLCGVSPAATIVANRSRDAGGVDDLVDLVAHRARRDRNRHRGRRLANELRRAGKQHRAGTQQRPAAARPCARPAP